MTATAPAAGTRQDRRKRATRARLLNAAFQLMAERGADAVAVNEITEAADLGQGTFYNHFESREAIYAALTVLVFEEFADQLETAFANVEDPAEVISINIQHTVLRARREPLWGRFLIREGLSAKSIERGLGARLLRDINWGLDQGRFHLADPILGYLAVSGGVIASISAELDADTDPHSVFHRYNVGQLDFPQRTATAMLHNLGLSFEEAQSIAERPLPELPANNSKIESPAS